MFPHNVRRTALLAAAVFLVAAAIQFSPATVLTDDGNAPAIPEKNQQTYPNLGSHLDLIAVQAEQSKQDTKENDQQDSDKKSTNQPENQDIPIPVTIHLSHNSQAVTDFLTRNGHPPANSGDQYIEALVPPSLLAELSHQPGVIRVRRILPPIPTSINQLIAGNGPAPHGALPWHAAGYTGQDIKVGIIERGPNFSGITSLMGTEVPSSIQARCYTDFGKHTNKLSDCDRPGSADHHGTLTAEALFDIAPQASLYIATPYSKGDMQDTVDWMASQDVSIIIPNMVWHFDGPGDGTSPFGDSPLNTVNQAADHGMLWVAPAGNYALRSWFSDTTLENAPSHSLIHFSPGVTVNRLNLRTGEKVFMTIRWDDTWEGATHDLDLYVVDSQNREIASSTDHQTGEPGHVPFEYAAFIPVQEHGETGITIVNRSDKAPRWVQLLLWRGHSLQYSTHKGSITNPSESNNPALVSVGAADWRNTNAVQAYSSRGPTVDGRTKPELVAVDCGQTSMHRFICGTSQAAPHLGGLAAVALQKNPHLTNTELAQYLMDSAEQRSSPNPNNTWGYGFAKLPQLHGCYIHGAVPQPSENPALIKDCKTLLEIRDAIPNGHVVNWHPSFPMRHWRGVTTGNTPPRATGLSMRYHGLEGTLPQELQLLTALETLSLLGNRFTGPIPPEIGKLSNLTTLDLSYNSLNAAIPASLGDLQHLQKLDLSHNSLEAAIPDSITDLQDLRELDLSDNNLTGPIPEGLAELPELNSLNLSGNRFTGCIPRGLADIEQNDLHQLRLPACPALDIPKLTIPDDLEIRPYREISITLTFDQPVAGITTDAPIVNAGTTTSVTGSGTAWTITILPTEIAPITVSLPQGAGLDQHGEPTPASPETVIGIPYDDDHNGEISRSEAITAVIEFFANLITKEQAIHVIILFFAS